LWTKRLVRDLGVTPGELQIAYRIDQPLCASNRTGHKRLKAAREMVAQPELSDETYDEISKGLDNERIVDLLLVISFYCGVVRLLGALQVDVEDDYKKYLQEFPLGG
jgi:alkylhydroperoxidase family enzyme